MAVRTDTKSQHEIWKYNHSFDYGMMVMLGKSWVSSQYLWVAIPTVTTTTTSQECTDCNKRIETDSNYCRYCGTKQKYDDRINERIVMNKLIYNPTLTKYDAKTIAAILSLIHGYDGPPLPAERVFVIKSEYSEKQYHYLYGYCKQPFPDLKLKDFEVRTSGIVYCDPIICSAEMNVGSGEKRTYKESRCADIHETVIPFHEFVDKNERVFELINDLAQGNINDRPVFIVAISTIYRMLMLPFALPEDWDEANKLIGGTNIDVKNISRDHLTSKVRECARIYSGKIMSSSFPFTISEL